MLLTACCHASNAALAGFWPFLDRPHGRVAAEAMRQQLAVRTSAESLWIPVRLPCRNCLSSFIYLLSDVLAQLLRFRRGLIVKSLRADIWPSYKGTDDVVSCSSMRNR
ncbi:TPA: hypothetical protein VDU61_006037 [Pseudomonas aeruginosa]|nr:hypothetical protein [Pseudomonas aeruginosa]